MEKRSPCGSGGCMTCPFSFNNEAEMVQNYGCLPEPLDIIRMKEKSGHNWACHGDETKMCGGYANWVKKHRPDLNLKVGNLISYDIWYREGEEEALRKASQL